MRSFPAGLRSAGPMLHLTLGVIVLVDVLRVFLPSLITIFGQAGGTPPELIGLYAVSWFVAAFLAVGLVRMVSTRTVALITGLGLLAGRLALQITDGGSPQLYVASGALLSGLCWLVAVAIGTEDARPAAVGVVWGLAVATALHAAVDTVDLVWRPGAVPVLLLAVELAAYFVVLVAAYRQPAGGGEHGTARLWFAIGPTLALWGLYTGTSAHAQASDGWSAVPAALVVSVAGMLAIALVARPQWTLHPEVPALVLVASAVAFAYGEATIGGVHGVAPWWTVAAQIAGALALAACLGWAATTPPTPKPGRRGMAAAGGLLVFVLLVFAYYSAYDLALPNDYVPIAAAAIVGALGVVGVRREAAGAGPVVPALVGAAVAALAVGLVPSWTPAAPRWEPASEGLRVAAYNIRMGFGYAGTLTIDRQADVLRDLRPHVIALGEVDRAWLLNGGHDDLRLIAERLGMRYIWAPAADEVWGDALLTDLPVTSVRNHVMVQGGPTGAQALEVRLRWNGRDVTVIATHLQPPRGWRSFDQAEQLADIVRAAPKPVILAGDLNMQPSAPVWQVLLAAGLTDPFAPFRPFSTIPTEGDDPEEIDHILTTEGFTGRDPANPDVPYSDHRAIAITLVGTS